MQTIKTFTDYFGTGRTEFSVPSLRIACESLGLEVWSIGAAWGYDKTGWFGRRRSFYLDGAYDPRNINHEREALERIVRSTRKGRRMIARSLAASK